MARARLLPALGPLDSGDARATCKLSLAPIAEVEASHLKVGGAAYECWMEGCKAYAKSTRMSVPYGSHPGGVSMLGVLVADCASKKQVP